MAQQPNVLLTPSDRPRRSLQPPASRGWRADKPGVPDAPDDSDRFGPYRTVGPDPGWAVKVVRHFDLPDDHGLEEVVVGLVMARAAALGRAAVRGDVEAVLALLGYDHDAPPEVIEQRKRWLAAVPYDKRPGETAVAEVDRSLLVESPEHIRWANTHRRSDPQ